LFRAFIGAALAHRERRATGKSARPASEREPAHQFSHAD
jgi:hypothetical protein